MQTGSLKDKTDDVDKSGVYEVSCSGCDEVYIGQSRRKIKIRYREHKNLKAAVPTAVATHIMQNDHRITKTNLRLVKWVKNANELDAYESIYMMKNATKLMNTLDAPIRSNLFNIVAH